MHSASEPADVWRPVDGDILLTCCVTGFWRGVRFQSARFICVSCRLDLAAWSQTVRRLLGGIDSTNRLPPEDVDKILDWCGKHGLLGIPLHCIQQITLAARWAKPDYLAKEPTPTAVGQFRVSKGWAEDPYRRYDPLASPVQPAVKFGDLVRPLPKGFPKPGVYTRDRINFRPKWASVSEAWGEFFPDVQKSEKETFRYPRPCSDEFWKMYGEPTGSFIFHAHRFAEAVTTIASSRDNELSSDKAQVNLDSAFTILNRWISTVSQSIYRKDGRIRQHWVAPSLLTSFAMMAAQDAAQDLILRCANETCGRVFVTEAYQAAYCSSRCRNTALKRASRRRVAGRDGPRGPNRK